MLASRRPSRPTKFDYFFPWKMDGGYFDTLPHELLFAIFRQVPNMPVFTLSSHVLVAISEVRTRRVSRMGLAGAARRCRQDQTGLTYTELTCTAAHRLPSKIQQQYPAAPISRLWRILGTDIGIDDPSAIIVGPLTPPTGASRSLANSRVVSVYTADIRFGIIWDSSVRIFQKLGSDRHILTTYILTSDDATLCRASRDSDVMLDIYYNHMPSGTCPTGETPGSALYFGPHQGHPDSGWEEWRSQCVELPALIGPCNMESVQFTTPEISGGMQYYGLPINPQPIDIDLVRGIIEYVDREYYGVKIQGGQCQLQ